MILCDLVSELDTKVLVRKAALQSIADLVASEEFVVDAVIRCLEDEDALVRELAVQCLAKVAPKGDARVILALAARRGDTSFRVRVQVLQVWPAVADKGDPRAVHAIATFLEHDELDVRCEVRCSVSLVSVH